MEVLFKCLNGSPNGSRSRGDELRKLKSWICAAAKPKLCRSGLGLRVPFKRFHTDPPLSLAALHKQTVHGNYKKVKVAY